MKRSPRSHETQLVLELLYRPFQKGAIVGADREELRKWFDRETAYQDYLKRKRLAGRLGQRYRVAVKEQRR